MKELSRRKFIILITLKENGKSMSSNNLCSLLNISPRTLRYEIKGINDIAGEKVIESDKNGYQIKNKELFYEKFKYLKVYEYLDTTKAVTLYLLEKENISIYDLAESCFISESTASNILKQLDMKFSSFDLKIKRKGEAIHVIGSEHAKRKMLSHFFFTEVDSLALHLTNFKDFFTSFELIDINNIVNESLVDLNVNIDTIYFKNIVISLAVALQRIIDHKAIEQIEDISFTINSTDSETIFLKNFVSKIKNELTSIQISDAEFSYMLSVIIGSFRTNKQDATTVFANDYEFRNRIRALLNETLQHYGLSNNYEELFDKFCLHIHYLLLRSINHAFFKCDKTLSLKYSHPFIYDVAVYLTYLLEKEFNCKINDDEIDLISIYIGTIITKVTYGKSKVVVICPKYNEIRKNLLNQLQESFSAQLEIVSVVESYAMINKNIEYDFIITTVRSEYILSNAIYISPIITPREIRRLENKLKELVNQKKAIEMKNQMIHFFDSQLFFYDYPLTDGNQILKFINQKLLECNYVPENFLESVYKRESLASSAFFNKFAVPHALDVYAKETKIIYYYNSKPIDWFGEKVNLVLLLTSKEADDNYTHIYNTLIDILLDNELFDQLIQCQTYDQLLDYVSFNM